MLIFEPLFKQLSRSREFKHASSVPLVLQDCSEEREVCKLLSIWQCLLVVLVYNCISCMIKRKWQVSKMRTKGSCCWKQMSPCHTRCTRALSENTHKRRKIGEKELLCVCGCVFVCVCTVCVLCTLMFSSGVCVCFCVWKPMHPWNCGTGCNSAGEGPQWCPRVCLLAWRFLHRLFYFSPN